VRPWCGPHALLNRDVPCAGCRARECPAHGHPCLAGVEPLEVAEVIERLAFKCGEPSGEQVEEAAA
jgi:hypothetical protein